MKRSAAESAALRLRERRNCHEALCAFRRLCTPAGLVLARGLHDAVIAFTEALEPSYGCGTHAQHNCLKLHLDSRDARESDIRCIALYDYEFAEGDLPKAGSWWLGDDLQQEAGRYILRAEWTDNREVYSFKVHFSSAEVERR